MPKKNKKATLGQRRSDEYRKFSKTEENKRLSETSGTSSAELNICPKCSDCETTIHEGKLNICVSCRFGINGHKKMARPKHQYKK